MEVFTRFAPLCGWVLRWAEAGAEVDTGAVVEAEAEVKVEAEADAEDEAEVEAGFQMVWIF